MTVNNEQLTTNNGRDSLDLRANVQLTIDDYQVESALFENALKGNASAQMFWLKNRCPERWNDKNAAARDPFERVAEIAKGNKADAESALQS